MEFLLTSQITLTPSIIISFLFIYYLLRKNNTTTNERAPPEPGGGWPIISHLPLLAGRKLVHKVLGALADKHGPIFTIRLGAHRAIVVSNSEIARECFTGSNDKVFLNRPKSIAAVHLSHNYANFGLSPYGPYWREVRKIAMLELLSNHRLTMLSHVWESDVKNSVKEVYEKWVKEGSCSVEMNRWFEDMILKLAVRLIAGFVLSLTPLDRSWPVFVVHVQLDPILGNFVGPSIMIAKSLFFITRRVIISLVQIYFSNYFFVISFILNKSVSFTYTCECSIKKILNMGNYSMSSLK